jgi:hemerythrin-like domain-containing protein
VRNLEVDAMKALDWMACEHEAIAVMLARLEAELGELGRSGELDVEAFERLLSFSEGRVDGHHQENEERVFLPRLMARAGGEDSVLARAVSAEHHAERHLLALMRSNLEGATYGEPGSLAVVAHHAQRYVQHQRRHARWESTTIFALARRVLTDEDDLAIVAGFRALERERRGSVVGAAEELRAWLEQRRPSARGTGPRPAGQACAWQQ